MDDLIYRDALLQDMTHRGGLDIGDWHVYDVINEQPTIEAEPVRHGRWETWGYVFHGIEWKRCSCCGKCADVSYYGLLDGEIRMSTPAICGVCGAIMDGGAENGQINT